LDDAQEAKKDTDSSKLRSKCCCNLARI